MANKRSAEHAGMGGAGVGRPGAHGAQRTTKTTQKLKLLPVDKNGAETVAEPRTAAVATALREAEQLGKDSIADLPRVTAYCTASSYRMDALYKFLNGRTHSHRTEPKQFDECLFTPYTYSHRPTYPPATDDLLGFDPQTDNASAATGEASSKHPTSEVFLFDYGVCVLWSMRVEEEAMFLKDIERFEVEKLGPENVEVEEFSFYITNSFQPRIYNDVITLREADNYMIKLAISHAIAQSVKISLFEEIVDSTIDVFKDIPDTIAQTGKVQMSRKKIMMNVGELFILRININLVGSVLDNPEFFWSEPQLDPIYQASRSYLEINQRVSLLNQRVEVISDLLQLLKQQISYSHNEYLEWIVIILIALEIFIALINIVVDWMNSG